MNWRYCIVHIFVIFVSTSVDSFCSQRITYMLIIIPLAKFIVLGWGDKVDSGMRLSYRPARLHRLAGQCSTGTLYCVQLDFSWLKSTMYVVLCVYREPVFVSLLWSPGIDSQPGGPVRQPYLSYRPARLYRLAESITGLLKGLQIRAQGAYLNFSKKECTVYYKYTIWELARLTLEKVTVKKFSLFMLAHSRLFALAWVLSQQFPLAKFHSRKSTHGTKGNLRRLIDQSSLFFLFYRVMVYVDTQRKLDPLSHIHSCTSINTNGEGGGGAQRDVVYLGWPRAPSYINPNVWGGGFAGSQPMSSAVHMEPNKLWRSSSIFYLCQRPTIASPPPPEPEFLNF